MGSESHLQPCPSHLAHNTWAKPGCRVATEFRAHKKQAPHVIWAYHMAAESRQIRIKRIYVWSKKMIPGSKDFGKNKDVWWGHECIAVNRRIPSKSRIITSLSTAFVPIMILYHGATICDGQRIGKDCFWSCYSCVGRNKSTVSISAIFTCQRKSHICGYTSLSLFPVSCHCV